MKLPRLCRSLEAAEGSPLAEPSAEATPGLRRQGVTKGVLAPGFPRRMTTPAAGRCGGGERHQQAAADHQAKAGPG